jgi:moderate conductance mechanosensitive channel
VIDVGVAYNEDPDEVAEVLRSIGRELQADAQFGPNILEPLEILGVDAFVESAVTLKIRIKTLPQKQWEVGREMRRRIKKTFAAKGVQIPFRHVAVYFGEASKPFQVEQVTRTDS